MPKIYESPDGGKTVYERNSGSTEKILIHSPEFSWNQYFKEHDWDEIAKDPNIQRMLERLRIVVTLCKE